MSVATVTTLAGPAQGAWAPAVEGYLTWLAAGGASRGTLRLRRHYLTRLAGRHRAGPDTLDAAALASYLAEPAWSAETRKSARATVVGFCRWAASAGVLSRDPAGALPRVRVPVGRPRPAPLEVVTAALERADERARLMVQLGAYAGLRRAEIAGVHAEHVELDTGGGWGLRVTGKGGHTRGVPAHAVLVPPLLALRARGGYAFPSLSGTGHLSPDRVGVIVSALLGPGYGAHTLRHAFATRAYAGSHDLRAVQTVLGHAKPETTMRYTLVSDAALRAAVDAA